MSVSTTNTRRALRISTALATGLLGLLQSQGAFAQSLPVINNADGAVISNTGPAPSPTGMIVNLTNGATTRSRDITWNTFDVANGRTLDFVATGNLVDPFTALNRVTTNAVSDIAGSITTQSNVAVWLINPTGIVFSNGATFSGGSLVLSTLTPNNGGSGDPDTDAILGQSGNALLGEVTGSGSSFAGSISIASGASIGTLLNPAGRVLLLSQSINVAGDINATGEVAMLLGHGITVSADFGSPLTYSIDEGARLDDVELIASGTVTGASVYLAALTEGTLTDALLQVHSSAALTATGVGGAVVLSAERSGGSADLDVDGTLTSDLDAVTVTADGSATLTGDVLAATTYSVTADSVALGGTAASTQTGTGATTITASGGNLTTTDDLTLTSDGNLGLTATGGDVFAHSAISAGGTYTVSGDVVQLGDGTATLHQAAGAVSITANGDLTIASNLDLESTGSTVYLENTADNMFIRGSISASGNIDTVSAGDTQLALYDGVSANGSLTSTAGSITVDSAGSVYGFGEDGSQLPTLNRGVDGYSATGSITVNATGDAYITNLSAGTGIALNVTGALLGSTGSLGTNVPGGALFANGVGGTVTVKANANNSTVSINTIEANNGVVVWADEIAIGSVNPGAVALVMRNNDDTADLTVADYFIGQSAVTGDLVLNLTDAAAITDVIATEEPANGPEFFDAAYGKTNLTTTTGDITGTVGAGAQLGTVTATAGLVNVDAGGIVVDSITALNGIDLTATAGTLSVLSASTGDALILTKNGGLATTAGDDLRLVSGLATNGATLSSSTSIRVGTLTASFGDASLTATTGDVSGLRTGTAGALASVVTGNVLSANYGSADIAANNGFVSVVAASGGAQLGSVNAGTDITASAGALTLSLAVAQQDLSLTATAGTLYLGTGSIGRTALVNKTGGLIATAGDEVRIGNLVGGTTTAPGNTTVNSSTHVVGNSIESGQGSVGITATAGDIVITNRVYGITDVNLTAGRDIQIAIFVAPHVSGYVESQTGNVTLDAQGSIYGIGGTAGVMPTTARGFDGYGATGNLTITDSGDLHVGSLSAGGNITLNITGALVGSTGTPGVNVPGGGVFANGAGSNVNIWAHGVGGTAVLNRIEAANTITIYGDQIAVGTFKPGAGVVGGDHLGGPIAATDFYFGLYQQPGDLVLNFADPASILNVLAIENILAGPVYGPETFDGAFGKTVLDAGGTITGSVGAGAQLSTVDAGGLIDLTVGGVGGLVADSITSGGSTSITANSGTLSILDANITGDLTLTKNGGALANAGDELRFVNGVVSGNVTLSSSTSIRLGDLTAATGNVSLTATAGDITGLRTGAGGVLPTIAASDTFSADYGRANLEATLGSLSITASAGAEQLGLLTSGTGITASALGIVADSAQAGGDINLTATSGTLYLGTATAGGAFSLTKSGTDDELRFVTLTSNGAGTSILSSSTSLSGTSATATAGDVQASASVDSDITTVDAAGYGYVYSGQDTTVGSVTAGTGYAYAAGVRDLNAGSVTSTDGAAYAVAGRNTTVGSVNAGTTAQVEASLIDATGVLNAGPINASTAVTISSQSDANLSTVNGDTTVGITVGGNLVSGAVTAGTTLTATITGNATIASVETSGGASITAGSLRTDHVTALTGNIALTATTGDISGLLTGTPGPLPLTTATSLLSTDYDALDVTAFTGSVTVTANSGAAQLGTVNASGDITGDALALVVASADAGGTLDLAVTSGTLYVGSGDSGLSTILSKTGAGDELRFGTVATGTAEGGSSGNATLTSSTNIRGTSISARGGAISVNAAGEVTGLSGGRMALSALVDLGAGAVPVPLSDQGINVTSGTLARLGNLVAGTTINVTAGVAGSATQGGAIDMLDATSARGDVLLTVHNLSTPTNGLSFEDLSGANVQFTADGGASGDITGQTITGTSIFGIAYDGSLGIDAASGDTVSLYAFDPAGNLTANGITSTGVGTYLYAEGDLSAGDVTSSGYSYLVAGGNVAAGVISSGTDSNIFAGNDAAFDSMTSTAGFAYLRAGGDITGNSGFTNSAAARPDIDASTFIDIVSGGSTQLDLADAGSYLSVVAGTPTSDGKIDINTAIAGSSITLDALALSPASDGDHDGSIRVDTATATTGLNFTNVARGAGIGDIIVATSASAGTDALIDAAADARLESLSATGTIAVRAGGAISGLAPNSAATLTAGEDLALKSGDTIDLGSVSGGDDLIIESTTSISVGALSASGSGPDTRSVSFASPTAIALVAAEPNPGASIVVRSSAGSVDTTGLLQATGSVTVEAADSATIGAGVLAGTNFNVTAVNDITLGSGGSVTQSANGAVTLTSSSAQVNSDGTVSLIANVDGAGTEALTITAADGILLGGTLLQGGNGVKQSDVLLDGQAGSITVDSVDAARLIATSTTGFTATGAIAAGNLVLGADPAAGPATVDIKVSAGDLTVDTVTVTGAGHDIHLGASGTIAAGDLVTTRNVVVEGATAGSAATAANLAGVTASTGAILVRAGTIDITGTAAAGTTLDLTATTGTLDLATGTSGTSATLSAVGAATIGSVSSSGPVSVTGASVAVSGTAAAGTTLGLTATAGNLNLGTGTAGGNATLSATGTSTVGSITSTGGAVSVTGTSVAITGAASAATTLNLDASTGDLDLGSGTAGGVITLATGGTATLGTVNAGASTLTLSAADAELSGTITASQINIVDDAAAGNALRLGDNAEGTGGFELTATEVNLLNAATVVFDAGTGTGLTRQDVAIGELDITNATIDTVEVNALQRIDLTGNLTGTTLSTLRLGGTATDTDLASVFRLAATGDGTGGLIDIGAAALELRAATIGAGQDLGFLDLIGIGPNPAPVPLDARLMVSNPASSLYSSTVLGGVIYQPTAQVMIRAGTMTVRYSDFALFQNTALPGTNDGVTLATAGTPAVPALRVIGPASPVGGPFALFGEVNGVRDIATALLGEAILNLSSVDRTSARINGCLVGSGAGCLTTLALSPALGQFDPVRGNIFFANTDFELPFDPLVGTNNDSLFGDVGTFGLGDIPIEPLECTTEDKSGCEEKNGDAK